jgi:hypothetical protein
MKALIFQELPKLPSFTMQSGSNVKVSALVSKLNLGITDPAEHMLNTQYRHTDLVIRLHT